VSVKNRELLAGRANNLVQFQANQAPTNAVVVAMTGMIRAAVSRERSVPTLRRNGIVDGAQARAHVRPTTKCDGASGVASPSCCWAAAVPPNILAHSQVRDDFFQCLFEFTLEVVTGPL
jgi:hypothetical protein